MIRREPTVEREDDALTILIPMTLKRRGGRREILVPESLPAAGHSNSPTQEPLVVALARAHVWQDLIDSGKYESIADLARALDVDRTYVSRTIRLAQLAPDIVEAILRGDEPSGLSLNRLTAGLPLLWSEQETRLGIGSRESGRPPGSLMRNPPAETVPHIGGVGTPNPTM